MEESKKVADARFGLGRGALMGVAGTGADAIAAAASVRGVGFESAVGGILNTLSRPTRLA